MADHPKVTREKPVFLAIEFWKVLRLAMKIKPAPQGPSFSPATTNGTKNTAQLRVAHARGNSGDSFEYILCHMMNRCFQVCSRARIVDFRIYSGLDGVEHVSIFLKDQLDEIAVLIGLFFKIWPIEVIFREECVDDETALIIPRWLRDNAVDCIMPRNYGE